MKGNLVKQWRTFKGWSVLRLVDEIHAQTGKRIGEATVKRWEGGRHEPHDSKLLLVAETLGIDYQTFLKGPECISANQASLPSPPDIYAEVYSYDGIQRTIALSRWIGFSYSRVSPQIPRDDYFLLYIDRDNPYISFGKIATCFVSVEPQKGDLLLTWHPKTGAQIYPFPIQQDTTQSIVVHGVIIV